MQSQLRFLLFFGLIFGLSALVAITNNQIGGFISVAVTQMFYLLIILSIWWFIWQRKFIRPRASASINNLRDVERYVQLHWQEIAFAAWQGHNRHGRGCVSIWANRNFELSFTHRQRLKCALAELDLPLADRSALLNMTDDYNPDTEVAVIFWTGKGKILYLPVAQAKKSSARI